MVELVRPVAAVAVLGAAAVGVYGLLQYGQVDPLPRATAYGNRVVSTFENPNYLGSFEALVLPLALVGFCRAQENRESAGWLVLVAAIYTGLLLSASRGAWIGAAAGCGFLLAGVALQIRRHELLMRRRWMAALVAMLCGITYLLGDQPVAETPTGPVTLQERILDAANIVGDEALSDYTVNHRYRIWQVTWELIRERPILGQGAGSYRDEFLRKRKALQAEGEFPTQGWDEYYDASYAHNECLHVWCESGLVALIGFLALVGAVVAAALWAGWRRRGEGLALWGGLGLVVVVLVHGLVSYPMQLPLSGTLFWLTLGGVAGLSSVDGGGTGTKCRRSLW